MAEIKGALIIVGNLNGLTIARSLGRRGIPVWVVTPPDIKLASCSRYVARTLPWPNADDDARVEYLLELGERHQLDGWVLFPTSDESAALLAKFRSVLSHQFKVSAPAWDALRWAYDKRLTYRLAAEQQVDYPAAICPTDDSQLETVACTFPAILKPATHSTINRFTAQKAWRVSNREELLARYREAKQMIPPDLILLQELIPGGGESQFSFAALCLDGKPIASLTARRTRQYPVDFGYSSSFVETLHVPEIVRPSQRLLTAMRYTGLVEVEYKHDARDGRYKLLDINPRLWTWAALGARAGVDFPYLLWQAMLGRYVPEQTARADCRWMRVSTDIPAAVVEVLRGRLKLDQYLQSFRNPLQFALWAADDPLPAFMDLPLFAYKKFRGTFMGAKEATPTKREELSSGPGAVR